MTFEIAFWSLFIGICGSLISNYISPWIRKFFGLISRSYKTRCDEKLRIRNEKIQELAHNETLLILANINTYFFDVFFILTFIIYLLLPPVSLFNMLASLFFGLMSMVAAYRGRKKRKLCEEALEIFKNKNLDAENLELN
jgi:hypothetical protein